MTSPRPEPTAVADANVLHSNDQRNVLMTLGVERLLDLRWTSAIETEWVRSLERRMEKNGKVQPSGRFAATARQMSDALPDHDVPGYERLVDAMTGTDAEDRHVAAAAAGCAPSFLLTWNGKDFDESQLAAFGVTVVNPDAFLAGQCDARPELVHAAVVKAHGFVLQGRQRRGQDPSSWEDYLDVLGTRGAPNALPQFVDVLRSMGRDDTDDTDEVARLLTVSDEPGPSGPGME